MLTFKDQTFPSLDAAEREALRLLNQQRVESVITLAESILAVEPSRPVSQAALGIALLRTRRFAEAVSALSRATLLDPGIGEAWAHLGTAFLRLNAFAPAEDAFRRSLDTGQSGKGLFGLGAVAEARGESERAFTLYSQSRKAVDNFSEAFVVHARHCFARSHPDFAPNLGRRPRDPARPAITITSLGEYGRFAHTVGEYISLRLFATRQGMELATPGWVGHWFFDLDDPRIDQVLPRSIESWPETREAVRVGLHDQPVPALANRDLFLNGLSFPVFRKAFRSEIRAMLRPRSLWRPYLDPVVDSLRRKGRTIVALHRRKGDLDGLNRVPPTDYTGLLGQLWPQLDAPVLYVASSDPQAAAGLEAFGPHILSDVATPWSGLEYLQDFHVLSQADLVICDVGGFSKTAAALNDRLRYAFCVSDDGQRLESFDPWYEGLP